MSAKAELHRNSGQEPENAKKVRRQSGLPLSDDLEFAVLMRLAQSGDALAYFRLLEGVTPRLRRSVRRQYGFLQPTDVEDLVQEILLSLHAARATYDPERPFLPWLMAIARNRMADAARHHFRTSVHEVVSESLIETFSERNANSDEGTYGDPQALHHAISCLPRGQRQAVELLKLREMSLKEAAMATGMSVGALKVAVHRGICALRAVLSHGV